MTDSAVTDSATATGSTMKALGPVAAHRSPGADNAVLTEARTVTAEPLVVEIGNRHWPSACAASCLVPPAVGDRVLASRNGRDEVFVIAVLERFSNGPLPLEAPDSDSLSVRAGVISMKASSSLDLKAPEMEIRAARLSFRSRLMRFAGRTIAQIAETIQSTATRMESHADTQIDTARMATRLVRETEIRKSGTLLEETSGVATQTADQLVLGAHREVRIDGERIVMG